MLQSMGSQRAGHDLVIEQQLSLNIYLSTYSAERATSWVERDCFRLRAATLALRNQPQWLIPLTSETFTIHLCPRSPEAAPTLC